MLLYHGSTMAVRKPIVSRGRGKTDFGKGFYTTTSREQAEKWAKMSTRIVIQEEEVHDFIYSSKVNHHFFFIPTTSMF